MVEKQTPHTGEEPEETSAEQLDAPATEHEMDGARDVVRTEMADVLSVRQVQHESPEQPVQIIDITPELLSDTSILVQNDAGLTYSLHDLIKSGTARLDVHTGELYFNEAAVPYPHAWVTKESLEPIAEQILGRGTEEEVEQQIPEQEQQETVQPSSSRLRASVEAGVQVVKELPKKTLQVAESSAEFTHRHTRGLSKWKGKWREITTKPVLKTVSDIVNVTGWGGTGAWLGWSVMPRFVVPAINAGWGFFASTGATATVVAGQPIVRYLNAKRKSRQEKKQFCTVVTSMCNENDDGRTVSQLEHALKRAAAEENGITTKQHAILLRALVKAGPTPAETRKLVFEESHVMHSAADIIRLIKIAKATDSELAHMQVDGLDNTQIHEWRKRLDALEDTEKGAIEAFDFDNLKQRKLLVQVAAEHGKMVEEWQRRERDKRVNSAMIATGVTGAAALATSGAALAVAAIPAAGAGIYIGARTLWNKTHKRQNVLLPNHKGIVASTGAPLPPDESYDVSGTLYRESVISKTSAEAGGSGDVKTWADAIRNAIPPDLQKYEYFDTKHDYAKALAPHALMVMLKQDKPAPKKDDEKVAACSDAFEDAKRQYEHANRIFSNQEMEVRTARRAIQDFKGRNAKAAIDAEKSDAVSSVDPNVQHLLRLNTQLETLVAELSELQKECSEASSAMQKAKHELQAATYPKSEGKFSPEDAINNADAQKALAVVVDEQWKEWEENNGAVVSFFRKLGVKAGSNKIVRELGKMSASVSVGAGAAYATAAASGIPFAGLIALGGGYLGWTVYKQLPKAQ